MPVCPERGAKAQSKVRLRDRWATSYADFVTILLILFVALAAQGVQAISAKAAPRPVQALEERATPQPKAPAPATARQQLIRALEHLQSVGLHWKSESRGVLICVDQGILFPAGGDQIGEQALPVVAEIAAVLAGIPNQIDLVGYADRRPIHSARFRDNWELSFARSMRLREVLHRDYGIDESRMLVASRGSNDPVSMEDTEEGLASNRRVEILILDVPQS